MAGAHELKHVIAEARVHDVGLDPQALRVLSEPQRPRRLAGEDRGVLMRVHEEWVAVADRVRERAALDALS